MVERKPFWKRQFDPSPTGNQIYFDVVCGIVAPLICLLADPIVFTEDHSPVVRFQAFSYALVAVSMVLMLGWCMVGHFLKTGAAFFAGALLCGGLFSLALGVAILPLSLVGLALLIGILGFTPFLTGFSYVRGSVRAFRRARSGARPGWAAALALLGILAVAAPSVALHREAHGAFDRLVASPASEELIRKAGWMKLFFSAGPDRLVGAFEREADPDRKRQLAVAYLKLTGQDLEERLRVIHD